MRKGGKGREEGEERGENEEDERRGRVFVTGKVCGGYGYKGKRE